VIFNEHTRPYRRFAAERVPVMAATDIAPSWHSDISFAVERDIARTRLLAQLQTYAVGMVSERIIIHKQWPADWWQAVRERWLPAWWLRRWPVRYEFLDINRPLYARVCPHVAIEHKNTHLEWLAKAEPKD
jgi:hypothetical protein